jgi:hypothetical protein
VGRLQLWKFKLNHFQLAQIIRPAKTNAKKITISISIEIPNIITPEIRTAPLPKAVGTAEDFDSVPANHQGEGSKSVGEFASIKSRNCRI